MTSNLWRGLGVLFGIDFKKKRFYTFMVSTTLPWHKLWRIVWSLVDSPETDGRILVGLGDCINPKVGKKIFASESIFDHAAKANQSNTPGHKILLPLGYSNRLRSAEPVCFLIFVFICLRKQLRLNLTEQKSKEKLFLFRSSWIRRHS